MTFFQINTPRTMLEKAKRELGRFGSEAEYATDHLYNFFVTAYHIVDTLPEPLKVAAMADLLIRYCADACNKAKHMQLTRGRPDIKTPTHYHAFIGPSDAIDFVERRIVWWDGTSLEVTAFAQDVIAKWEGFFREHGV